MKRKQKTLLANPIHVLPFLNDIRGSRIQNENLPRLVRVQDLVNEREGVRFRDCVVYSANAVVRDPLDLLSHIWIVILEHFRQWRLLRQCKILLTSKTKSAPRLLTRA